MEEEDLSDGENTLEVGKEVLYLSNALVETLKTAKRKGVIDDFVLKPPTINDLGDLCGFSQDIVRLDEAIALFVEEERAFKRLQNRRKKDIVSLANSLAYLK